MAKNDKQEKSKRIYTTEIINNLLHDAALGLEIDTSPFFMGDLELRDANIVFQYTDEEIAEFQKCAEDPIYFTSKYCKFQNDKGRTTVKLRDFQEDTLHMLCDQHYDEELDEMVPDNRNCVIMASRQTGKCVLPNTTVQLKNKKTTIDELYKEKETILSKIKSFLYKLYDNKLFFIRCIIGFIIQFIEYLENKKCVIIDNKFIDSQDISNEILTDTGYHNISKIYKTIPYNVYRLELLNGYYFECAENHKVFNED